METHDAIELNDAWWRRHWSGQRNPSVAICRAQSVPRLKQSPVRGGTSRRG